MAWKKKARQAIGILGQYISQSLKYHIELFAGDPAGAWLHLKDKFGKNTVPDIYNQQIVTFGLMITNKPTIKSISHMYGQTISYVLVNLPRHGVKELII